MVTKAQKSSLNGDLVNLCSLLCQQEALPFIRACLLPLLYRVMEKYVNRQCCGKLRNLSDNNLLSIFIYVEPSEISTLNKLSNVKDN